MLFANGSNLSLPGIFRFDEFCEYLLPYRSLQGYPLTASGEVLAEKYRMFVCRDTAESLAEHIRRYNRRIAAGRNLLGWQ